MWSYRDDRWYASHRPTKSPNASASLLSCLLLWIFLVFLPYRVGSSALWSNFPSVFPSAWGWNRWNLGESWSVKDWLVWWAQNRSSSAHICDRQSLHMISYVSWSSNPCNPHWSYRVTSPLLRRWAWRWLNPCCWCIDSALHRFPH